MNGLLQWELDWIDRNVDMYSSKLHAAAVKENIIKRYRINELESRIAYLELSCHIMGV